MEIYKDLDSDKEYVRYVYNGNVITNWADCREEYCDLDVFIGYLNKVILPDDEWNYYCN